MLHDKVDSPSYVNPSHFPPMRLALVILSGVADGFYSVKVLSMYLTSISEASLGLNGGLIFLSRIAFQSTPLNH